MSADNVQLIKDKISVEDLIGEYVQLKRAGANLKGLCPFHSEKTPSFMVSPERQTWHCFGCAKGGDIFSFIQEIEGMEFVEALRFLAGRAGVELETFKSEINKSQKNRIFEINNQALRFFYNFLDRIPAAKPAKNYLFGRGLSQENINEWMIGFAPDQWDLLTKYLLKKGFAIDDLVASGLTIKRDDANKQSGRGYYDRFRGRIMFPIWDINENVVGFTGRVLVETATSGGKYVNTPQTCVYDKSTVLFGLNKAKRAIREAKKVLVVEGQMDAISCFNAGMQYVVASSGTALTEKQIKLLSRYTQNIIMSFDADSAGQSAAKRGVDIAVSSGMNVKVVLIPEGFGKDPDECIKKDKAKWFDLVENAKDIMDWNFERVFRGKNIEDPKEKQSIAEELLSEINLIPKEIEKDHWLQALSSKLLVSVEVLRNEMQRIQRQPKKTDFAYAAKKEVEEFSIPIQQTRMDYLLEEVLVFVFKFSELFEIVAQSLKNEYLVSSEYKKLYEILIMEYNSSRVFDLTIIKNQFATKDQKISEQILAIEGKGSQDVYERNYAKRDLLGIFSQLEQEWKKNERQKMQKEIEAAMASQDRERVEKLYLKINEFK